MAKFELIQTDKRDLKEKFPSRAKFIERIKRGDICDIVVDTETTGLSQAFAHPSKLGAVVADPFTRTVIHIHSRDVAIPDHAVMGAIPSLITDRRPDTFKSGMRPDLAIAELYDLIMEAPKRIADHYEEQEKLIERYNESKSDDEKIPVPPEREYDSTTESYDNVIEYQYVTNQRTKWERDNRVRTPKQTRIARDVVFIPMKDEDGNIVYDAAISKNGKQVYYKEDDKWYRVEHAKKTIIMQNARADNNWLWEWFHQYLLPHKFITHTKYHGAYQIDTLPLMREVNQLGAWEGRTKLILPEREDPELGKSVTASKDPVLKANTRLNNPRLNVPPGMRLPDGSHQDEVRGHVDPAVDCLEELAIYWYCEDVAPEIVAYKKRISDHDTIKDELLPMSGLPPVKAFVRARWPYLGKHMGVVINTDRAYGDFKRAVAINLTALHRDPRDPIALRMPDGRNIFDLTKEDWIELYYRESKEQSGNGVLEVFRLNKGPMIHTAETGMNAGANHGIPYVELQKWRDLIQSMPATKNAIMEAYAEFIKHQKLWPDRQYPDPRPEEYRFNDVGDPPRIQIDRTDGDINAKKAIENAIFKRAHSKREYYLKRNHYIRLMIRPNPELESDILRKPGAHEDYQKLINQTLKKYNRLVRGLQIKDDVGEAYLDLPEKVKFDDNGDALAFLWDLRRQALREDWLVDLTTDKYWLVDKKTGHEIPQARLRDIEIHEFNEYFKIHTGRERGGKQRNYIWDVEFERLNYSKHFLAGLFVAAGRLEELEAIDPGWRDWYDARLAFGNNGSPFIDADRQRLTTNASELKMLDRIKRNTFGKSDLKAFSSDPDIARGMMADFVDGLVGRQQQVAELDQYYNANMDAHPWTEETLPVAGYDPVTRMPLENIVYPVSREAFERAAKISLPFAAPARPMQDPRFGEMLYPVAWSEDLEEAWKKGDLKKTANRVFQCPETGEYYLAPKSAFRRVEFKDRPDLKYLWQQTSGIFEASGLGDYPEDKPVFLVSAEGMIPLAGTRVIEPVTEIQVPGQHRFLATVSPELAGFHSEGETAANRLPLTGLAVPDYEYVESRGYKIEKDCLIRLRETDDRTGRETGREVLVRLTGEPEYWTLQEFEQAFHDGEVTPSFARQHGYTDPRHMYSDVANWFTKLQKPKESSDNRILLIKFEIVEDFAHFDPKRIPRAAITDDYYATKQQHFERWGSHPMGKLDPEP